MPKGIPYPSLIDGDATAREHCADFPQEEPSEAAEQVRQAAMALGSKVAGLLVTWRGYLMQLEPAVTCSKWRALAYFEHVLDDETYWATGEGSTPEEAMEACFRSVEALESMPE